MMTRRCAPGGEVNLSTTHRLGGVAPRPHQHADNPGHQTAPTDFVKILGPEEASVGVRAFAPYLLWS